ncbi:MAG TPA: hypothetical protein VJ505_03840 [Holophagaceae bacterium]|nr:hypothetical protein [Holophagaceae bacterium]
MRRAVLLSALLATVGSAQEIRWGLQAHGTFPKGDLAKELDDATGLGGGLHMLVDFGGISAIRPKVEVLAFKMGRNASGTDTRVEGRRFGVDYLFFPAESTTSGFYLLAGLDYTRWETEHTSAGGYLRATHGALGGELGGGYQFNRLVGLELSAFQSKFQSNLGAAKGITLGVTLRY